MLWTCVVGSVGHSDGDGVVLYVERALVLWVRLFDCLLVWFGLQFWLFGDVMSFAVARLSRMRV
jgi:hypothetical protein